MLTNYARWYSFTPPQSPTLSPPLTHDQDVSVVARQFLQNTHLDPGGVLELVHHRVPDGSAGRVGNVIVLHHPVGPHLQVSEVHGVVVQQEAPVAQAASAQGGDVGPVRADQLTGVDKLVADAVEVPGCLARRLDPVSPTTACGYVLVGTEYSVDLLLLQQALFLLVQDPVA